MPSPELKELVWPSELLLPHLLSAVPAGSQHASTLLHYALHLAFRRLSASCPTGSADSRGLTPSAERVRFRPVASASGEVASAAELGVEVVRFLSSEDENKSPDPGLKNVANLDDIFRPLSACLKQAESELSTAQQVGISVGVGDAVYVQSTAREL